MSDEVALLLILAGLHVMESCLVVPHGSVVFRTTAWARYAAFRAGALMRVSRGRFVFLNPLLPGAHVFAAGLPHILPTADGVLDVAPEEDNAPRRRPLVPWGAIGTARASGADMICEGLGSIPCGSPAAARVWARVLNTLRAATPARRAVLVDRWLRLRFDPKIARRRIERVDRACAAVEVIATAAFLVVIAAGVLVTQRVSETLLIGFLGTGVVSGLVLAFAFWRAHARLEPRDWSGRLGRSLMMAACFPVAFRARASVGRDALALAHPVAIAAALLPKKRALPFLADSLRRWIHRAAAPRPGTIEAAALARSGEAVAGHIREAARAGDVEPASLESPPRLDDPAIQAWCPRCHATYVHAAGTCVECPGVSLRPARR